VRLPLMVAERQQSNDNGNGELQHERSRLGGIDCWSQMTTRTPPLAWTWCSRCKVTKSDLNLAWYGTRTKRRDDVSTV